MTGRFPEDRFDRLPADSRRVGVHRARVRRSSRWIPVVWALVAAMALSVAGILALSLNSGRFNLGNAPTVSPTPTIQPTIAPALAVLVLNGTSDTSILGQVQSKLSARGVKIGGAANASTSTVTATVVYYAMADQQAAALGVAGVIGTSLVQLNAQAVNPSTPIVVVIGQDLLTNGGSGAPATPKAS